MISKIKANKRLAHIEKEIMKERKSLTPIIIEDIIDDSYVFLPREKYQMRQCLGKWCNKKTFRSYGIHNRMCEKCKKNAEDYIDEDSL